MTEVVSTRCNCPICGKLWEHQITEEEYDRIYPAPGSGKKSEHVQKVLAKYSVFERELYISGLCFDCQEEIFHRPKPGNDVKWGKRVGSCCCCERPVYEIDIVDGEYLCDMCGCDEYEVINN